MTGSVSIFPFFLTCDGERLSRVDQEGRRAGRPSRAGDGAMRDVCVCLRIDRDACTYGRSGRENLRIHHHRYSPERTRVSRRLPDSSRSGIDFLQPHRESSRFSLLLAILTFRARPLSRAVASPSSSTCRRDSLPLPSNLPPSSSSCLGPFSFLAPLFLHPLDIRWTFPLVVDWLGVITTTLEPTARGFSS